VPTVAEAGYPGYEANTWNGIVAPAGTPKPIVDRLNAAMVRVLQMPDVRETMIADGAEPAYNTPEQFGAYIRACHAKWAKVIKSAGLREGS
jgi:tripartite-type tricarboxylate transporter receptor subunit TctC